MKILYLGANSGTSAHRFRALTRLGHETELIDPRSLLPHSPLVDRIEWKVHPGILAAWVGPSVLRKLAGRSFDVAFVDNGSLVSASLVTGMRRHANRVVNFNHDNPFVERDGVRFAVYREALPAYDLVVVVRDENVEQARSLGARNVMRARFVADDIEHAPLPVDEDLRVKWASDVSFIGTWMPERGQFLLELLQLGVPLSIYGDRWSRAPEWPQLRKAYRGPALCGDDYRYALQCSKICLGLLSQGNRDESTTRSMEIPSLGSVLCAQRTSEHLALYREGEEALFWNDAGECARICRALLENPARLQDIAARGRARFLRNGDTSENLLRRVLARATEPRGRGVSDRDGHARPLDAGGSLMKSHARS